MYKVQHVYSKLCVCADYFSVCTHVRARVSNTRHIFEVSILCAHVVRHALVSVKTCACYNQYARLLIDECFALTIRVCNSCWEATNLLQLQDAYIRLQ